MFYGVSNKSFTITNQCWWRWWFNLPKNSTIVLLAPDLKIFFDITLLSRCHVKGYFTYLMQVSDLYNEVDSINTLCSQYYPTVGSFKTGLWLIRISFNTGPGSRFRLYSVSLASSVFLLIRTELQSMDFIIFVLYLISDWHLTDSCMTLVWLLNTFNWYCFRSYLLSGHGINRSKLPIRHISDLGRFYCARLANMLNICCDLGFLELNAPLSFWWWTWTMMYQTTTVYIFIGFKCVYQFSMDV